MVENITIRNFKCFEHQSIDLSMLNVLTGINGTGKSTVIQAFLALMQSFKSNSLAAGRLELNGEFIKLGTGTDVLFERAVDNEIYFGINEDEKAYEFHFEYEPDARILGLPLGKYPQEIPLLLENEKCRYLSANRIVPEQVYRISNNRDVLNRYFGNNGEYAIQYLALSRIENERNGHDLFPEDLWDNVKNEMGRISHGIEPIIRLDTALGQSELNYSFRNERTKTNTYKALNVGFGATNILPVIILLLSAKSGELLLLENPEVHIHPRGQQELGELIAKTAGRGVQIILETHSDHIMNGIRIAVKNRIIAKDNVNFTYFYVDDDFTHDCLFPKLDENGHFDFWPSGFFDVWDEAMMNLL